MQRRKALFLFGELHPAIPARYSPHLGGDVAPSATEGEFLIIVK
jgi:hypothetical protein